MGATRMRSGHRDEVGWNVGMADEPEPMHMPSEEGRWIANYLDRVVRPVVSRVADDTAFRYDVHGSGQVIRLGDRFILVTAGHNLVEDGWVHQLGVARSDRMTDGTIHWLDERRVGLAEKAGIDLDPWEVTIDVAVVELSDVECRTCGFDPIALELVSTAELVPEDNAVLIGFPVDRFDQSRLAQGIVKVTPVGLVLRPAEPGAWPPGLFPGIHHVLDFPMGIVGKVDGGAVTPVAVPDPGGMSGCGIWGHRPPRGSKRREFGMVGVAHEHPKDRSVIVGTGMRSVLSLIAETYPDTADIIRSRFGELFRTMSR